MLHAAMLRALALGSLLGLALPVQAAPAPIVFDFEDGLQGWKLHGSAQRVQTQLLGGEWAIFGDALIEFGAGISTGIDFTNLSSMTMNIFFLDGSTSPVVRVTSSPGSSHS